MRHFLQLALSQCQYARVQTLPPRPKPAVVEIGKERGSAEAASQRADAALSWNGLEGGVLGLFKRLGTERVIVGLHQKPIAWAARWRAENQVTLSASSLVITEGRPTVRQLTRKCCRDLERITAS